MMWDDVKKWWCEQLAGGLGFWFELHFEATCVVFVIGDVVLGGGLVMQALPYFCDHLFYDVR